MRAPGTAVAAQWRDEPDLQDPHAEEPKGNRTMVGLTATGTPIVSLDYIESPQDTSWTNAGSLQPTTAYRRQRLPVGKQPYGMAFRFQQLVPSAVTRIFDLGIEHWESERSRL